LEAREISNVKVQSSNVKWLMSNDKGTPARFTDTDTRIAGLQFCGAAVKNAGKGSRLLLTLSHYFDRSIGWIGWLDWFTRKIPQRWSPRDKK
jgi:hypothetical protein